jgi:hypothetical protein
MVKLNVTMDNDILLQLQMALARFGEGSMPGVSATMHGAAEEIAKSWRFFAGGGQLDEVKPLERPNRSYLFGVKTEKLGPFDYEIYNETEAAQRIAKGHPAIDMKKTHTRGPRSRVSKEKINYLIVPFRWGTPPEKGKQRVGFKNVMPNSVYNILKNRKRFMPTITTVGSDSPLANKTPNARGEMVGRAQYSDVAGSRPWGGSLTADMAEGVTDDMKGMSRMLGEDGKAEGYFTFRIISSKKPRGWDRRPHKKAFEDMWILKEEPARDVVSALIRAHQTAVSESIEEAIRSDLHGILPQ